MKKHITTQIRELLMFNLFGGPKLFPARYAVNFFKGLTLPFCLLLLKIYPYTLKNLVYASLHGSYGLIWLLKDQVFPDNISLQSQTLGSLIGTIGLLVLYWLMAWWQIACNGLIQQKIKKSQFREQVNQSLIFIHISNFIAFSIFLYSIGLILMMVSDAQKYFTVKFKKGLISDGMFKLTRNPNYLGEIFIYGSFGLLAQDTIVWSMLLFIWTFIFGLNMWSKDQDSLSKKEGWITYKRQSNLLFPKLI